MHLFHTKFIKTIGKICNVPVIKKFDFSNIDGVVAVRCGFYCSLL